MVAQRAEITSFQIICDFEVISYKIKFTCKCWSLMTLWNWVCCQCQMTRTVDDSKSKFWVYFFWASNGKESASHPTLLFHLKSEHFKYFSQKMQKVCFGNYDRYLFVNVVHCGCEIKSWYSKIQFGGSEMTQYETFNAAV